MDGYAIRFADLPGPWRVDRRKRRGPPLRRRDRRGRGGPHLHRRARCPPAPTRCWSRRRRARRRRARRSPAKGPPRRGGNVRRRGLDFSAGDALIARRRAPHPRAARASRSPAGIAELAGRTAASASRSPRPATNWSPPGAPLDAAVAARIATRRCSRAMLADLPVEIVDLGILPDDLDDADRRVRRGRRRPARHHRRRVGRRSRPRPPRAGGGGRQRSISGGSRCAPASR